jgi:hypothetical protein
VSKEKSAMKVHPNYLIASFLFVICGSCEKDDQNPVQLIGKWKLVEQLVDPGDGSGVFESIFSDKTISFYSNGSFSSTGPMCTMDISSNTPSAGSYSLTDGVINPSSCPMMTGSIYFEIIENNLILSYPCIEPCRQKFKKAE